MREGIFCAPSCASDSTEYGLTCTCSATWTSVNTEPQSIRTPSPMLSYLSDYAYYFGPLRLLHYNSVRTVGAAAIIAAAIDPHVLYNALQAGAGVVVICSSAVGGCGSCEVDADPPSVLRAASAASSASKAWAGWRAAWHMT